MASQDAGKADAESDCAAKELSLRAILREMQSVVVAYSGGVDSSYLAWVAASELQDRALCVTGVSPSVSEFQLDQATEFAASFGLNHLTLETHELDDTRYASNPDNRCYFCKSELFGKLLPLAASRGFLWVADGSTTDDTGDYRPGREAAAERGIRSPLVEACMSKSDVRELSRRAGLPTWDAPASPCLASRIAYGTPVTIGRLSAIERGEDVLRRMGFREFRVRDHGGLARIEISRAEFTHALREDFVTEIAARFRLLGFRYVTLDLDGFRSGAMNEVMTAADHLANSLGGRS